MAVTPSSEPSGSVVEALRAVIGGVEHLDTFDSALASIALVLADVVDGRGPSAVPAARELSVLGSIRDLDDDETKQFMEAVRTPVVGLTGATP